MSGHQDVPTLVFDDSCPMCQLYTGAFSKLGWADRRAFGSCDPELLTRLDLDRARHEIPMIDPASGEVQYGLDSLFTVIGGRLRFLQPLLSLPFAKPAITPIYALISYNRRQIAGCPPPTDGFDCAPDFHVGWVGTYIGLVTAAVLALARRPAAAVAVGACTAAAAAVLAPATVDATTPRRFDIASQSVTAVAVGALAARVAGAVGLRGPLAATVGIVAGGHQVWRRRFLRHT